MITVADIRKKAERLYVDYLKSVAAEESFFPCPIRSNKQVSSDFRVLQKEIAEVVAGSTDRKGYGYTLVYEMVQTRRHGEQNLPVAISFETEQHYLRFIGKESEAAAFKKNRILICQTLPLLKEWCIQQVRLLVDEEGYWDDLLKVCLYFASHPRPELYIRELPIEVHTKFIEQHIRVLQSLLNALLPPSSIRLEESRFVPRFYLKEAEPMIRFRVLDSITQAYFGGVISDITLPISQFQWLPFSCQRVFIVENKMNFLTFPSLPNAIVVWGQGFQVEVLKGCEWLKSLTIVYWGDMDVHGFLILSQVRGYFPQTRSLMMDQQTLDAFSSMVVPNEVIHSPKPMHLTPEESQMYQYLKDHAYRLEQEKINHAYVVAKVKNELPSNCVTSPLPA